MSVVLPSSAQPGDYLSGIGVQPLGRPHHAKVRSNFAISNTQRYAHFFREMLDRGFFLAPSQFEAAFVSAVHTPQNIDDTIAAASAALKVVANDS